MKFEAQEIKTYQVNARCSCGGYFVLSVPLDGKQRDDKVITYKHNCTGCDSVEWLTEGFPVLRYVPADKHFSVNDFKPTEGKGYL